MPEPGDSKLNVPRDPFPVRQGKVPPRAHTVLAALWLALLLFVAVVIYFLIRGSEPVLAIVALLGAVGTGYPLARITRAVTASEGGQSILTPGFAPVDFLLWRTYRRERTIADALATAQSRIADLEERHRLLTHSLAASVVVRDLKGKILYASPYTEVLTGYALGEIYDSENDFFHGKVHEQDRERYAKAYQIMSTGEAYQLRYRFMHKAGMDLWFETRTVPLIGEADEVISFLSVTFDITQNVRYQRQVEERNRDLQDFTYMVSHDLKAPIYTMKGMIGVLEEELGAELQGDAKEALEHIRKAAANLEALIASVLRYSRVSTSEAPLEPVDVNVAIADVVHDLAVQISDAQAEVVVQPGLSQVQADRARLYQVFSNLIGNAIKFRSPERPCRVEVREVPCPLHRHVSFEVCDNGIGIPADKVEVIFRPFQRGHQGEKVEGWGVGLASVSRLLEKLGGSIEVHSNPGEGSTFRITLWTV